ncbi:hypothetical protein MHYP_G00354410 [Metynnis hypsauchen]
MAKPKHLTNPPPVAPKIHTIARVGQPLPGMVRSISLPENDQPNERGERLIVMRKDGMDKVKNPTLRSITEAPNPSDFEVKEEAKTNRERLLVTQRSWDGHMRPHTPALPDRLPDRKRDVSTWRSLKEGKEDKEDDEDLMEWWRSVQPWGAPPSDHLLSQETARKAYTEKAQRVKKALLFYDYLLSDRGNALYNLITELIDVAKNLDKVYKGAKIAGITGGTAGAAGVAAAVGGVLLAPLTMGASLAVAAVGVGVAAAGGITGASAAITNKVHNNMDRKRVEKIFIDYTTQMEDIESCVQFISTGMEHLRSHKLQGVEREVEKVAGVDSVVWVNAGAISAISKSSGLIQGFALGMDIYFTKDDTQKLKKGSETKFAKQIRLVAHQMETTLNELMKYASALLPCPEGQLLPFDPTEKNSLYPSLMEIMQRVNYDMRRRHTVGSWEDRSDTQGTEDFESSGLIQGFVLGMDMYFTKNNTQKLKKGSETKFAKQIREVAQQMQNSLDELMRVKAVLASTDI